MNGEIKNSLVFICLNESFGEKISKKFADSLNMHFASCKELIEYDLFDSGDVISQCGEEYYLMRERKAIKRVCSYENSIMFSTFDIFYHNKETFDQYSTKIYLKIPKKMLSKEDVINKLAFDDRNNEMEKLTEIIINLKNDNEKSALKEIYKVLGGIK